MSTNVAETQLMQQSIAAACITDPVHIEGGQLLALQLARRHQHSLKESLQQASFLRLPTVFMRTLPRNASTGKVQKALVQEALDVERVAEQATLEELRQVQQTQLRWYWSLVQWSVAFVTSACVASCLVALAFQMVGVVTILFIAPLALLFNLYAFSWIHVSFAYAALDSSTQSLLVLVYACSCKYFGLWPSILSAALLAVVLVRGAFYKAEAYPKDWARERPWLVARLEKLQDSDSSRRWAKRVSPFRIAAGVSLLLQVGLHVEPARAAASQFCLCLCVLVAYGRMLPRAPDCKDVFTPQRVVAFMLSMMETTRFLICVPVPVLLILPKLVMSDMGSTWGWEKLKFLNSSFKPVTKKQAQTQYEGPEALHSKVWSGTYRDGSVWIDLKPAVDVEMHAESASTSEAVHASTEAGRLGQRLARDAGLDFQGSTDSLRLVRLSVLLKKHMQPLPGEASVELQDLREACVSEQNFVAMVEARLCCWDAANFSYAARTCKSNPLQAVIKSVRSWAHGDASIHREGATQAPWSCQVDNLLQWSDSDEFDFELLQSACRLAWHAHPMVRTRPPRDDSDDMDMGSAGSGMSTLSAAIWSLIAEQWSSHASWGSPWNRVVRHLVPRAVWYCWPRLMVLDARLDSLAKVNLVSAQVDTWQDNPADQAHELIRTTQSSWWDHRIAVNNCVVILKRGEEKKTFWYSSLTHKYADGGAAAAYVHSVGDFYQQLRSGSAISVEQGPVVEILERRLWRYVSALCPQDPFAALSFDIVNDIYDHGKGMSLNVEIAPKVCNMMHIAGQCMGVSEEVAWLVCFTCALCRLLPDEKVIKILLVHSGRTGNAADAVACVSQYVMFAIPVARPRAEIPLADIASRVSDAISKGLFRRTAPCEQAHMRVNINGMIGQDGPFATVFRSPSWRWRDGRPNRAAYSIQLRMDKQGPTFSVMDFKCHEVLDARQFWHAVVCVGLEFATGACDELLAEDTSRVRNGSAHV